MKKELIYQLFTAEFHTMLKLSTTSFIEKFRDAKMLFERYWTVLKHAYDQNFEIGLDFGCGTCPGLILGKLMDIKVEGLDIIEQARLLEPLFWNFQKIAQNRGYTIYHTDTDIVPWELKKDHYNFVLCWDSFFTDWKASVDWKDHDVLKTLPRAIEINRILKPGGILYIGGAGKAGNDIDFIKPILHKVPNISMQVYHWNFKTPTIIKLLSD